MVRIALFGATGMIGSRITAEALGRGHTVTAVLRTTQAATAVDPRIATIQGDVLDPESVADAVLSHDVVVSAVGGGGGPENTALIEPAARTLVGVLRTATAPVPLLVTVGGAGSLRTTDGTQVWDAAGIPEGLLQTMHAHGDALEYLRTVDDIRWVNVSPASKIAPGQRTGHYRVSLDDLIVDDAGDSRISAEDYAVAVLDEIDAPAHIGRRFTVAY